MVCFQVRACVPCGCGCGCGCGRRQRVRAEHRAAEAGKVAVKREVAEKRSARLGRREARGWREALPRARQHACCRVHAFVPHVCAPAGTIGEETKLLHACQALRPRQGCRPLPGLACLSRLPVSLARLSCPSLLPAASCLSSVPFLLLPCSRGLACCRSVLRAQPTGKDQQPLTARCHATETRRSRRRSSTCYRWTRPRKSPRGVRRRRRRPRRASLTQRTRLRRTRAFKLRPAAWSRCVSPVSHASHVSSVCRVAVFARMPLVRRAPRCVSCACTGTRARTR